MAYHVIPALPELPSDTLIFRLANRLRERKPRWTSKRMAHLPGLPWKVYRVKDGERIVCATFLSAREAYTYTRHLNTEETIKTILDMTRALAYETAGPEVYMFLTKVLDECPDMPDTSRFQTSPSKAGPKEESSEA